MFNFNIRNTRTMCEICWKMTKTPEQTQWRRSSAFILSLNFTHYFGVSIVNFEQVNAATPYVNIPLWKLISKETFRKIIRRSPRITSQTINFASFYYFSEF